MRHGLVGRRRLALCAVAGLAGGCNVGLEEPSLPEIDGDVLLVANKSAASVWAIDVATKERVRQYFVPTGPHEVAVSPDGTSAVVSIFGGQVAANSLVVIDLTTFEPRGTLFLGPYLRPHGLVYLSDRIVAVTSGETDTVVLVDVVSGELGDVFGVDDDTPHMIVASPTGDRVWTSNAGASTVSEIDLESGEVVRLIDVDAGPEALAISPDGTRLWVGSNETDRVTVIDTETGLPIDSFVFEGRPIRIAFLPDGSAALVTYLETGIVRLIEAQALTVIDEVDVGGVPVGTLVHPDGNRAYIADGQSGQIVVIDTFSMEEIDRIDAGFEPDGMGYIRREPN